MKIRRIILENFANIWTAMSTHRIEIDFSKGKNKIILITGPNGGGKTSVLSCLHPFANNGNLDVRNDNPLVIVGKNGYKEIEYEDGNDIYLIKHFYTHNKESHTIKSYIEKNGTELNPNGNQSSFKEIVKEELDIEPDYLKLVRLGNNVTNFIDHKTTERKTFMGKILSEVDIYLKFFKKVNKDMIELKSIISHLLDKISKLSIDDPKEFKKSQEKLKERIHELKDKIDEINSELSIINHELSKYDSESVVKSELEDALNRKKKLEKLLEKKSSVSSVKDCEDLISQLQSEILLLNSTMASYQDKRSNLLNQQNKLLEELDGISRELPKIDNSTQITDTEHIIRSLKDSIDTRCKQYGIMDDGYPYSKKEIEDLIITLDKCNDILQSTYEFGKDPVHKAISFFVHHDDINSYVEGQVKAFQKTKLQAMSEYILNTIAGKHLPKPNCNMSNGCEVMEFYDKLYDLATEIPDIVIEDETFVTYTKLCYQNISTILGYIKDKKSTFVKLPKEIQDMFTLEVLFDRMRNLLPLYEKQALYSELNKVTEYELMMKDVEELKSQKEKLKLLKSVVGNSEYFQKRKEEIMSEIYEIRNSIITLNKDIDETREQAISKGNELEVMRGLKESLEQKDSLDESISNLEVAYGSILELREKGARSIDLLEKAMFEFNKLQNEFNNNDYRIRYYETYNEELKKYNESYDEMNLVRTALSAKEGIPLLFIQIYLKNVQEITNELLEVIYGNELSIDDFIITADEFKIPFTTKGTSIKDVCYASQGERSFISLALSFALIYQSISRYNILLLDEIDATLDTENRGKFLQVLEKHINMIDGEQVFVISHNNMFNMYPVDVINTKNEMDDNNRLAYYLKIDKK